MRREKEARNPWDAHQRPGGRRARKTVGSALEEHTDEGDSGEHADPEQAELRNANHGGLYAIQMVGMVMIQDGHGRLLIFP
jgi:hypothetical protein